MMVGPHQKSWRHQVCLSLGRFPRSSTYYGFNTTAPTHLCRFTYLYHIYILYSRHTYRATGKKKNVPTFANLINKITIQYP